jgi:hypothetical protein
VDELPSALRDELLDMDERLQLNYQYELSVARGWKVGGWPSWHRTDKQWLSCRECGGPVELLLAMDSSEWDGAGDRWQPIEDRGLEERAEREAYEPTGLDVARGGELRVFLCRTDAQHDPVMNVQ